LGSDVLLRVLRHSSRSIKQVVEVLSSRIISSQAAPQYTECLMLLILDSCSLFMENPALLGDLVEQVCSMSVSGAKRVLLAMQPIIKTNRSLRDSTILALRKALFARSAETKQIGIVGVLQLLQTFKISSSLPVTQGSLTSSQLSQVSSDLYKGVATPSESLCSDLMGVLRRGLTQSAQVRLKIYHGLYDVVGKNPALCNNVLDVLYEHAVSQEWHKVGDGEDQRSLINLEKQIAEEDGRPLLLVSVRRAPKKASRTGLLFQDPVGWYVHCVQQILGKSEQLYPSEDFEDDADLGARNKLTDLLNDWTKKYAQADLLDLDFEKNASFSTSTAEGEKNLIRVENTKNIYESLMEFTMTHGVGTFEESTKLLLNLYKRHHEVSTLPKV
jgi:Fanconi anemia group I protein